MYINYGCGLDAPKEWINFDASPGLRIQKNPLLYFLFKSKLNVKFPENVIYGDITKGLPGITPESCKGVYCSHVLEHLALEDFRIALKNTYTILQKDGIFRCVVPDLQYYTRKYLDEYESGNTDASLHFLQGTDLGQLKRPRTIKQIINAWLTNARHLWMWDEKSLFQELQIAGFINIRKCSFNDSTDPMFLSVERQSRFTNALAVEAIK